MTPDLSKLPKERKDWLEVFGNTWGTRKHEAEPLTAEEKAALAPENLLFVGHPCH